MYSSVESWRILISKVRIQETAKGFPSDWLRQHRPRTWIKSSDRSPQASPVVGQYRAALLAGASEDHVLSRRPVLQGHIALLSDPHAMGMLKEESLETQWVPLSGCLRPKPVVV